MLFCITSASRSDLLARAVDGRPGCDPHSVTVLTVSRIFRRAMTFLLQFGGRALPKQKRRRAARKGNLCVVVVFEEQLAVSVCYTRKAATGKPASRVNQTTPTLNTKANLSAHGRVAMWLALRKSALAPATPRQVFWSLDASKSQPGACRCVWTTDIWLRPLLASAPSSWLSSKGLYTRWRTDIRVLMRHYAASLPAR
jgi:hypothetical protein